MWKIVSESDSQMSFHRDNESVFAKYSQKIRICTMARNRLLYVRVSTVFKSLRKKVQVPMIVEYLSQTRREAYTTEG